MPPRPDSEKVTTVFNAALRLGSAERRAYLEEACVGDDGLRSEVESMLEASAPQPTPQPTPRPTPRPTAQPAPKPTPTAAEVVPASFLVGATVGSCRVLRVLAQGGMGLVY
ncbi:MAG: hypothetical protein HY721_01785, partial [Planctomycetes bacterium]|nr:hypothetical protein [Planctomycetota bacterium]